ncbi:MAG: hypothetical protein GC182_06320 [Rhodopseudomonas sp.]|nr:hypothetical protein [Rhodopseudomonas sp.]
MSVKSALTSAESCRPNISGELSRLPRLVAATLLLSIIASGLAGCGSVNVSSPTALQPRGASVAFDSIDGPPPAQFNNLVRALNDEAQSRHLAVVSREGTSAYRVRGYLTAKADHGRTTIAWLWDVFDRDGYNALQIKGAETAAATAKATGRKNQSESDLWRSADDAMLQRIARASMDQLAAFLTSPNAAPVSGDPAVVLSSAPAGTPAIQQIGLSDSSPEAKGIYRIFRAHADPALEDDPNAPDPAKIDSKVDSKPAPHQAETPSVRPDNRAAQAVTLEMAAAEH